MEATCLLPLNHKLTFGFAALRTNNSIFVKTFHYVKRSALKDLIIYGGFTRSGELSVLHL